MTDLVISSKHTTSGHAVRHRRFEEAEERRRMVVRSSGNHEVNCIGPGNALYVQCALRASCRARVTLRTACMLGIWQVTFSSLSPVGMAVSRMRGRVIPHMAASRPHHRASRIQTFLASRMKRLQQQCKVDCHGTFLAQAFIGTS